MKIDKLTREEVVGALMAHFTILSETMKIIEEFQLKDVLERRLNSDDEILRPSFIICTNFMKMIGGELK